MSNIYLDLKSEPASLTTISERNTGSEVYAVKQWQGNYKAEDLPFNEIDQSFANLDIGIPYGTVKVSTLVIVSVADSVYVRNTQAEKENVTQLLSDLNVHEAATNMEKVVANMHKFNKKMLAEQKRSRKKEAAKIAQYKHAAKPGRNKTKRETLDGMLHKSLQWFASCNIRWRDAEVKALLWSKKQVKLPDATAIAKKLKISMSQLKKMETHKSLRKIFCALRSAHCYKTYPGIIINTFVFAYIIY